jgi:hypothetical protein
LSEEPPLVLDLQLAFSEMLAFAASLLNTSKTDSTDVLPLNSNENYISKHYLNINILFSFI